MRMENVLMLTLAFVINVFVVCVFAEVRPFLNTDQICTSPCVCDSPTLRSPSLLVLR